MLLVFSNVSIEQQSINLRCQDWMTQKSLGGHGWGVVWFGHGKTYRKRDMRQKTLQNSCVLEMCVISLIRYFKMFGSSEVSGSLPLLFSRIFKATWKTHSNSFSKCQRNSEVGGLQEDPKTPDEPWTFPSIFSSSFE